MWIQLLPSAFVENLDVIALLLLGLLVEKKYISRPAIWANVAAINVQFYKYSVNNEFLIWYANIGLIVAGLALLTYESGDSLPGWYYTIAWIYSSIPVALLIFLVWNATI